MGEWGDGRPFHCPLDTHFTHLHTHRYAAVVAHTLVVGATVESPVTGSTADAILAAHNCAEAALRLIKAGNTNVQVHVLHDNHYHAYILYAGPVRADLLSKRHFLLFLVKQKSCKNRTE